jgi:formylglycine-generating enzyme required for sulfatase activity
VGWFFSNSSSVPHPIATKTLNELGLADMSGNVYEWCSDWYDGSYYTGSPSVNPAGPATGVNRIIRGGAYDTGGAYCRVTYRGQNGPAGAYGNTGFRCVVDQ